MKHTFSFLLLIGSLLALPVYTQAQEVSREEFNALSKRLAAIEAKLDVKRSSEVESIAAEALAAMPANQAERESFIEEVVMTIQKREEKTFYPWMNAEKWSKVQKGMSARQVIDILGPPVLDEPSLHKRKDRVFTWMGRRVSSAKRVEGIVRFYKGEVIEIEPPVIE